MNGDCSLKGQSTRDAIGPSPAKAKQILKDGKVHGKPLTARARRFMGARAGGAPVKSKSSSKGGKK